MSACHQNTSYVAFTHHTSTYIKVLLEHTNFKGAIHTPYGLYKVAATETAVDIRERTSTELADDEYSLGSQLRM